MPMFPETDEVVGKTLCMEFQGPVRNQAEGWEGLSYLFYWFAPALVPASSKSAGFGASRSQMKCANIGVYGG